MIHEEVKRLKQEFFAYRNGIVADMLRDAGDCHKVIFGLNIPQLIGIANETGKNADVARKLWQNADCRESRLLAPMIFPAQTMTVDEAHQWMEDVENVEIADNLYISRRMVQRYIASIYEKTETKTRLGLFQSYMNFTAE